MAPISDVRDISRIAYGFMASKALFAALNIDLFGRLADGPRALDELSAATGVTANRLRTLLEALSGLGLVVPEGGRYANAPASQRYLVREAPAYFGDYYRFQIERIIYPALEHLDAGLRGDRDNLAHASFEQMLSDEADAEAFSRAQHAGSLGPAMMLEKSLDLSGCRALLDVAGGSGAFSIILCRRYEGLSATIIDFPTVIESARRYVAAAGLEARIALVAGNALEIEWPADRDVVLMSYLLSAVAEDDIPRLLDRAWEALKPGGRLIVHDFMLDDDRAGPDLAALWFLQYLAFSPDGVSFSPANLTAPLAERGFTAIEQRELIHDITKVVLCRKPE